MKQQHADAHVVPYSKYSQFAAVANWSVRHKPMIHGLFEVDVTRARTAMRTHHAKTGESLSFTAFLATCLAKAVDEDKAVQAFRKGGKHLVLFEDVDINTRIERDVAGQKYVVPYIIRAANRKTFRELHNEIRAAQVADMQDVLKRFRLFSTVPTTLFRSVVRAFTWLGRMRPQIWKETMGTVGITSVGMFGDGSGWGVPASSPTALMMTVGGIGEKRMVASGHTAVREYLCLTISVDHNLIDGAPAARFTHRLKDLIEGGYGLGDSMVEPGQAGTEGAAQQKVDAIRA